MAQQIIKRGEIYWADLGSRNGHETQDVHPVIIISNDKQNTYSPLVIIIPITSKIDKIYPFEVPIKLDENSKVLTDKIAALDKKRIGDKIGNSSEKIVGEVVKALHSVLDFPCFKK